VARLIAQSSVGLNSDDGFTNCGGNCRPTARLKSGAESSIELLGPRRAEISALPTFAPTNHSSSSLPRLLFGFTPEQSPEYCVQGEPPRAEAKDDQRGEEEREFGGLNKFIRMSPDVQDGVAIRDPVSDRQ
jgi:hypothetical protein